MDTCKDCIYYDESDSYKGTGYCTLYSEYVNNDDNCDDWEGE